MSQRDDGTRGRILDAAGAIFAELGFEKATIRDICAQAEVNLAAVNYHFGDKERLYQATIRHAHERAATQVPLPDWGPECPPEQKLRDFIRTVMQRMLVASRMPWQARLMMREFVHPTGACQQIVNDYIRPHFQILLSILNEMLPVSLPDHRRCQIAFSVIGQCMFYKMNDPVIGLLVSPDELEKHFTPEQLSAHISDLVLAALGRRPLFSIAGNNLAAVCGVKVAE